jgi:long-subunit fatty acid transport protein
MGLRTVSNCSSVEPVAYTRISPKRARGASGIGDLETTLTYRFHDESEGVPALAAALEVKFPTAHDDLIGTGKTDYAGYLIASKRIGRTDLHFNLSYAVIGQPNGEGNVNAIGYAAAAEYSVSDRLQIVAEYVGQTSAGSDAADGTPVPTVPDSAFAPEAGGAETFGMVGIRYQYADHWAFAFGVSYDNSNAWLVRPGVTYNFR